MLVLVCRRSEHIPRHNFSPSPTVSCRLSIVTTRLSLLPNLQSPPNHHPITILSFSIEQPDLASASASAAAANGVTTEGEEGEVGVGLGLGPYAAELVRKSQRLVMRSALKLVHLLAAQVARSDETEVEAAGARGELESVGLVKVASGPETLSKVSG